MTISGGAFGPDDQVAVVTSTELVIVNTTTDAVRLRIPYPNGVQGPVAFSHDGNSVAVATWSATGGGIDRWDLSGPPRLVETIPAAVTHLAFSPDGTSLAWTQYGLRLRQRQHLHPTDRRRPPDRTARRARRRFPGLVPDAERARFQPRRSHARVRCVTGVLCVCGGQRGRRSGTSTRARGQPPAS